MSTIVCLKSDCPYRSKRPLRKFRLRSGEKAYGCTLPVLALRGMYDPDGAVRAALGYNPCECVDYRQIQHENWLKEEGGPDENL